MKELGLEVTLFAKNPDVGGVWRANYADFGLQVPWELYEFPGFRYKPEENFDKFPRGGAVQSYIQRYATDRKIYENAVFNTRVTSVAKDGAGWKLTHQGVADGSAAKTVDFDFVVVCTGMYSTPNRIPYQDEDKFKG